MSEMNTGAGKTDKIKSSLPTKTSGKNPRYPAKTGTAPVANWKNPNGTSKQGK